MPRRKNVSIFDIYSPELPFATEFRRLLHKVQNAESKTELKTLLFTSAMLSEGKSTICSFLGVTAAHQKGMKTLIVDADLRRPAMHRLFGIPREPGLSEILIEGFSPKDTIRKTGIDKLDVITAGREVARPAEAFDAEVIAQVLDELKFFYDLVLVDSAPLLPVSDPMLLAPKMDSIVLIIKAGATQSEVVLRAVEILGLNRLKILGVVLNNLDNALPYYYGYGYYGYKNGERSVKKSKPPDKKSKDSPPRKSAPPAKKDVTDDHIVRP